LGKKKLKTLNTGSPHHTDYTPRTDCWQHTGCLAPGRMVMRYKVTLNTGYKRHKGFLPRRGLPPHKD
jgi:hypothetical protein